MCLVFFFYKTRQQKHKGKHVFFKKNKFLDSHSVVVVKTFFFMYQLLYSRTDIDESNARVRQVTVRISIGRVVRKASYWSLTIILFEEKLINMTPLVNILIEKSSTVHQRLKTGLTPIVLSTRRTIKFSQHTRTHVL